MRNKTPFISRSRECAAYLGGFDWTCHWSQRALPAAQPHLDIKLMWGRALRCQNPGWKIVTSSEPWPCIDSSESRTKPEQILHLKCWWHLPRKDFCLQMVIYSSEGGRGSWKNIFSSVVKSSSLVLNIGFPVTTIRTIVGHSYRICVLFTLCPTVIKGSF